MVFCQARTEEIDEKKLKEYRATGGDDNRPEVKGDFCVSCLEEFARGAEIAKDPRILLAMF